jgi:NAD(P)-dependent dehydrogenase (short-subunit alcohol dehydrogenase family)
MQDLVDKTCVVTGGASGIGLAMARRFKQAGMHIALGDVDPTALAAAVADLGGQDTVLGVTCDVTSPESVAALRQAVIEHFGSVHVVCLNAGVAPTGSLLDTALETWRWLFDVNVFGVVHGLREFGPLLVGQGEGHAVLTASVGGLVSAPPLGAYVASKHAVVGLAAQLRDELAPAGVGVSVVCPGPIRTRIAESERNRPASATGATHTDEQQASFFRDIIAQSPEPALVANAVHDAVVDNRLFVLPSRDVYELIRGRLDEIAAAMSG